MGDIRDITHLKENCIPSDLNIEHLYNDLSAYEATRESLDEFKGLFNALVAEAKETRSERILNIGGEKDLIITEYGCRLVITLKTFEYRTNCRHSDVGCEYQEGVSGYYFCRLKNPSDNACNKGIGLSEWATDRVKKGEQR